MEKAIQELPGEPGVAGGAVDGADEAAVVSFREYLEGIARPDNAKVKAWYDNRERQARDTEAAVAAACKVAMIPSHYEWTFLGSPADSDRGESLRERVVRSSERFARTPRVILCGAAGTGKTALAVAMLRTAWEWSSRKASIAFVPSHRLATARIQHQAGHGEAPFVEMAMTRRYVVIDDLDEECKTATDATRDVLIERHMSGLSTWITTNLTEEQIRQGFSGKIRRRLTEDVRFVKF